MDVGTEGASSGGAGSEDQSSTWKVYSPANPTAVELRLLHRHLLHIVQQLADLSDRMEIELGSDRDWTSE